MQQSKLVASDGAAEDAFGFSVALIGDTALVGANQDDVGETDHQGSAYIFTRNGISWSEQAHLVATDGEIMDRFGTSVALWVKKPSWEIAEIKSAQTTNKAQLIFSCAVVQAG